MFPIRAKDLTAMILRNQVTAEHLTRSQERSWLGDHPTGKKSKGQIIYESAGPQNYMDSLITSKAGIQLAFICIVFGESEGLLLQTP